MASARLRLRRIGKRGRIVDAAMLGMPRIDETVCLSG